MHYDAIIIGSGQAGFPLAGALTDKGWSVALAEGSIVDRYTDDMQGEPELEEAET